MKILSDLHFEFYPSTLQLPTVAAGEGPTILAGDIFPLNKLTELDFCEKILTWFQSLPQPVFYVFGNHEFYHADMQQLDSYIALLERNNVIVLNNKSVQHSGVTYHGTTLWTNTISRDCGMNDYRVIRNDGLLLTTKDTARLHFKAVEFLLDSVKQGDVIISHHAPSYQSISPVYYGHPANRHFYTNLEWIIEDYKPSYWIHGHTHQSSDYTLYNTRVISNPHGYLDRNLQPENKYFNLNLAIV